MGLSDPDKASGDLNDYLRCLRKEAFDPEDKDVVCIDPGMDSVTRYNDIMLPCERLSNMNNTLTADGSDAKNTTKNESNIEKKVEH